MAKSPTGILPEDMMRPGKLQAVMAFLRAMPGDGDTKVEVFLGWARAVGVSVNASQQNAVRNSGADR